jgi:hypothetical protein
MNLLQLAAQASPKLGESMGSRRCFCRFAPHITPLAAAFSMHNEQRFSAS